MIKSFKYLPQNERKKIVIICDDIRVHSGVATVAKEIVSGTAQHFNWVNIAGAVNHPDKGKVLDLSKSAGEELGIDDAYVKLYCTEGYGTEEQILGVLEKEQPDALMLFTDPRYFTHVFNAEDTIRKKCPIFYLNIWDDYPAPRYNQPYYESCDLLMGISKQTVNINKLVLADCDNSKRVFRYLPHGLNHKHYFPIDKNHDQYKEMIMFKKEVFKNQDVDFVLFFNSRNIRRKQIPDTMLAFRAFLDSLPKDKAAKCRLLLHTELSTNHGTDLVKVKEYLFDESYEDNVVFSTAKLDRKFLNFYYNIADAQILLTSNEGWGLTITEAMLAGTPLIANVTGGMQDQMRFIDDKGKWFTPSPEIPSNHNGTFKKHGEWVFPVFPTNRSIQGSPPTPYIFDDRCKWEDACDRIKELYGLDRDERKKLGLKGREWAISDEAGFTAEQQAKRFIEAAHACWDVWEPREQFEIVNATAYKGKTLNHKIYY